MITSVCVYLSWISLNQNRIHGKRFINTMLNVWLTSEIALAISLNFQLRWSKRFLKFYLLSSFSKNFIYERAWDIKNRVEQKDLLNAWPLYEDMLNKIDIVKVPKVMLSSVDKFQAFLFCGLFSRKKGFSFWHFNPINDILYNVYWRCSIFMTFMNGYW